MTFQTFYQNQLPQFETVLFDLMTLSKDENKQVNEAMVYSLKAGGKRLRPLLLLLVLEAFGKDVKKGYKSAAAVEMIHTYSLIHDDLPAMDNDDMRRGKPSNHKVFGEAGAILAGDALLTKAFEVLSTEDQVEASVVLEMIRSLSDAAGNNGMIAGQQEDIEGEGQSLTLVDIQSIHRKKTGALLEYSLYVGGLLAGCDQKMGDSLRQIAEKLGIAYQIRDDILDITGDEATLGKPVGSDLENSKSTYPSLLGLDGAKEMLTSELDAAKKYVEELKALAEKAKRPFDKELLNSFIETLELGA